MKKLAYAFIVVVFFTYPFIRLDAQIVPGQKRTVVESLSGKILWESTGPVRLGSFKEVLYAGRAESDNIPVLALYVGETLLTPIFFVEETSFLRAMSKMQADVTMTQKPETESALIFVSDDKQSEYRFSSALAEGKILLPGLAITPVLTRFLEKKSSCAIIHVDYLVAKALGYTRRLGG